ncbi:MAG: protein kinase [Acidobacteriota bacterium]|nr:protein kinase [Acidobacteriota bacterium]
MNLEPGSTLGPYEIVAQIGAGGMGVVWKALDPSLKRHVAIKILPATLNADPQWRQRFQQEAEAAAALQHPNIAVIHQVGEHDGNPYIVMQYLDGQTLRQILREGPMPTRRWLAVGVGIADGLAHAQKNGIVHQDLKPDNVMITTDGQVKILDFGLAKVIGSGADDGEPRDNGKIFGSRSYMSPEQIRGEKIDHRSDLFAFGVLLYEMAGGCVPFRGKTDEAVRQAITEEEPAPLSDRSDGIPTEVERVVRKAMEKEPERRYQHADELATDLRNLKRDLSTGRATMTSEEGPSGLTNYTPVPSAPSPTPTPTPTPRRRWPAIAGIAAVIIAVLGTIWWQTRPTGEPVPVRANPGTDRPLASRKQMIAVLPFENLGDADDEYFAVGMTQEITSRLASVVGLGVISSKSAIQYADTDKTPAEIGAELGVDYLLEGSVRWARSSGGKSRVRITPQLVNVADETAVWSDTYDEVIDDMFTLESAIAEKVIDHIGITLSGSRWADDLRSTDNLDAYRAYMQGQHLLQLPIYTEETYKDQIALFEEAIELDPEFAAAYAGLSRAHAALYHFGHDRTMKRQELAKKSVEKALELAPTSPDVHFALGNYFYWCHKDYERALDSFAFVQERMPSKLEVLEFVGFIWRRQGRWEEAAGNLERAIELNPMDANVRGELGSTYNFLRRYDDALAPLDHSIGLLPLQTSGYFEKTFTYWMTGDLEAARATLERIPPTDHPAMDWYWFRQQIYEQRYEEALLRLEASPVELMVYFRAVRPKALFLAELHDLMGHNERARDSYEQARQILEREIKRQPDDYRLYSALGIALAGLGEDADAIRAGTKAVDLYPIARDAVFGPQAVEALALIYARIGEDDLALDQIEQLLSIPSLVSVPMLAADPRLKKLHGNARFQELIVDR